MPNDALTALLLDPFLTFAEAEKVVGALAPSNPQRPCAAERSSQRRPGRGRTAPRRKVARPRRSPWR